MKKILVVPLCFLILTLKAQQMPRISELSSYFELKESGRVERVRKYIEANDINEFYYDSLANLIQFVDIDLFGKPVFRSTLNSELAFSTGASRLWSGGSQGLDLNGSNLTVGVWDGGSVFNHIEFENRMISVEAGSVSDHATHVAGTIAAAGFQSSARGMAFKSNFRSFDWNNDNSEMLSLARPDETGILFSNHSYGLIQGWFFNGTSWQWSGNSSISNSEDWRFGFYTTEARDLDLIAYSSPFYSIFWAAGNDRDDLGPNGPPQDGNGGSGFDCLAQEGTAKNIFTIGAIRKITSYTTPSDVVMSNFSSWGPTDDGRIKPDLVAPGVNILSTFPNNQYGILGGTSMASPGAMGSLMLVQDLHKRLNSGRPMRSATLKSLAIHTAKEAGQFPGPDYSFGWGVVDAEAASKHLLSLDNQNNLLKELTLRNQEFYELKLSPKSGTKVKATIAWTDPAGAVSPSGLDVRDIKLVNDLDMRIYSNDGEEQLPWVLNPADAVLGEAAYKGNNFRDNVEKIEFLVGEAKAYTLKISHKNTLTNGEQSFSLILSYESTTDPLISMFWVGNSGDWDEPNNWSSISGGVGGFGVPNELNKVVFDERSVNDGDVISINKSQKIGSFVWLNGKQSSIKTNFNDIKITGNILIAGEGLQIENESRVILDGSLPGEKRIAFLNNKLENTTLVLEKGNSYELSGTVSLDSLILVNGNLALKSDTLNVSVLNVLDQSSSVDISNTVISNVKSMIFKSTTQLISTNSQILPAIDAEINLADLTFKGTLLVNNSGLKISGNNKIESIKANQPFLLTGSNTIKNLVVNAGGSLKLNENTAQALTGIVEFNSTTASPIKVETTSGSASFYLAERRKLCFDNLRVSNVSITGEAIVNAGINSQLTNAVNWEKDICANVLFPDFTFNVNCVGSLIALNDISEGLVSERKWTVPSTADIIEANDGKTYLIARQTGEIEVLLQIENASSIRSISKKIDIIENDLPANTIIINGNNLFSVITSPKYQWFKDFEPITNATGRNFNYSGTPGLYFVLTESEGCNRISSEALISSLEEKLQSDALSHFWPNPVDQKFYLSNAVSSAKIISLSGIVLQELSNVENTNNEHVIVNCQPGIFVIEMFFKNGLVLREKFIIK